MGYLNSSVLVQGYRGTVCNAVFLSPTGGLCQRRHRIQSLSRLHRSLLQFCLDAELVGSLSGDFVDMPPSLRRTYESLEGIRARLQALVGQPHSIAQLQPLQVRRRLGF